MLTLLVESGFLYVAFFSLQMMTYSPQYGDYGWFTVLVYVFRLIWNQGIGMYPTIIIVLVHFQQTVWDCAEVSAHLSSLHLASTRRARPAEDIEQSAAGVGSHVHTISQLRMSSCRYEGDADSTSVFAVSSHAKEGVQCEVKAHAD